LFGRGPVSAENPRACHWRFKENACGGKPYIFIKRRPRCEAQPEAEYKKKNTKTATKHAVLPYFN
jgi:hypothetical protein